MAAKGSSGGSGPFACPRVCESFYIDGVDADALRVRRARRAEFLKRLYQEVDASVNQFVDGLEVGAQVGADDEESRRIIAYFEEKGLVKVDDHKSGVIRITALGIDAVETVDS